jgi:hypothetical protein
VGRERKRRRRRRKKDLWRSWAGRQAGRQAGSAVLSTSLIDDCSALYVLATHGTAAASGRIRQTGIRITINRGCTPRGV